jgi:serine acetyltransferase
MGDHVIIGCHSSIIGAVTIGDCAMIAANSLVIDHVPAGFTAIGVPAKLYPEMSPRWDETCSGGSKSILPGERKKNSEATAKLRGRIG